MTQQEIQKSKNYFDSVKLEIKEIEIDSPIKGYNIGNEYSYSGQYKNGHEKGISKIKRIYKEVLYWNGEESELKKDHSNNNSVWLELENGKLILMGFIHHPNVFTIAESFRIKNKL